jgi:hypothetical protein
MPEKDVETGEGSAQLAQTDDFVDWDGSDDPENPLNWTPRRKNVHVAIVSAITLTASVPAAPKVTE